MHEYSIVQSLLDKVESEAARHRATAVTRLHLELGELSGVEVDLLRTAWETFRERSLCAGAPLEIETVPVEWACPRCEQIVERGAVLRCGSCGVPARLRRGDEIVLQRIEMEVA